MNEEKSQDTIDSLSRQIVDVLHKELGDKCNSCRVFPEAMWVAMQAICGPHVAASTIRCCQVQP
ncbi:hypothetical protein IOQ16_004001 [Salmonella enterica]|nr:hypothetical protein [Salmonella enterica subsp. enterica serovar Duisburg]EAB2603419.1 hypothetical protein [Salmonella enterica]EBV3861079.1 hypothetical protein [Salmonella enterica subsp. enterica serovar Montevideo]ECH8186209.1 hypothetical protein [Salmonella enterica subsp. enterica serovar Rissen]EDU2970096.1 hypothetical protein [Salmonella enterica subsp. enterica serovar Manhattan]EDW9603332.1 hypothetical protein [Salmonella enterica subsp. enterica serovar Ohio]EEJ6876610.1 hy